MTIEQLKETKEFKELGYSIVCCPVCGKPTLDNYWICDNCNWEYDGITDKEEYSEVNHCTLEGYITKQN